MSFNQELDKRDIRTRLLCEPGQTCFDAASIINVLVEVCMEIIDHYEGLQAERPAGDRPRLTDCVEAARDALRRVRGEN
jgi:hypothetical protein